MWDQYTWIVVVGAFAAFFMAYGIGANDVANAFATSVGAGTLTIRQALCIAGVLEFAGALLLGAHVTSTIKQGIAKSECFVNEPEVLMYGMLCSVQAAGIWLIIATSMELPVSTTHSIVAAIAGMAVAAGGFDCVLWYQSCEISDTCFPPVKGMTQIIIGWLIQPPLAAIIAAGLFLFVRWVVLRRQDSFNLAWMWGPFFIGATVVVNVYYILYKGVQVTFNGHKAEDLGLGYISLIAWGLGAIVGVVTLFVGIKYLKPRVYERVRNRLERMASSKVAGMESGKVLTPTDSNAAMLNGSDSDETSTVGENRNIFQKIKRAVTYGSSVNVMEVLDEDKVAADVHSNAEVFDPYTEEGFKYLQVFTAQADSFAHGANDVANAMGPFAAIWSIYNDTYFGKEASVPYWILAIGGLGIVVGLGTYGYNIMRALGVRICKITPSRGFAIELGSALVVVTFSRLGLPVSTTHCQVGTTVGVALVENIGRKGALKNAVATGISEDGDPNGAHLHWKVFIKTFCGWGATLVLCAIFSGLLFAQGAYAPSIPNLEDIRELETAILKTVNATRMTLKNSDALSKQAGLNDKMLNDVLKAIKGNKTRQTVDMTTVIDTNNYGYALLGNLVSKMSVTIKNVTVGNETFRNTPEMSFTKVKLEKGYPELEKTIVVTP